ncbi:MAG: ATPase, T2SS/T4P/T4SS family, partial [Solirubrobacterales bacterium]
MPADEGFLDRLSADLHGLVVGDTTLPPGLDAVGRIQVVVEREAGFLAPAVRGLLAERIAGHALAAGPLERLLRDPTVDEVLVDGTEPIWVERGGCLEKTSLRFASDGDLREAIERLLTPAGRRVDEAQPLCDARLPDGSRINVVLPPLAVDGPALTVRRFRPSPYSAADLVAMGTWDQALLELFEEAVVRRHQPTGPTGNALSSRAPFCASARA